MKHVKMFEQFVEEKFVKSAPITEKKEEEEKEEGDEKEEDEEISEKKEEKEEKKDDKKEKKEEKKEDKKEEEEKFFFTEKDLQKSAEDLAKLGEKSSVGPAAAATQIDKYLDKHAGKTPPSQKKALKGAKTILKEIVVKNTEKGRKS